jgi:Na+-transporting methylmalonyl-CoA/oxaloacetate decarboxylase gamma subunit
MFIGQGSSVVGVCVVYGLSSLVHPFNCLYKPLIEEKKKERQEERTEEEEEEEEQEEEIV